jgi:multidrug efflux pump
VNISAPFIRRPVATSLLTIALLLAGIIAYRLLPVAPLPQVDFPTIGVSASLPGASPETMASSVATPLERQFGRIAGVTQMTSASQLGSTSVTLQFDLSRNIDAAARDVQASINAARGQLPQNLPSNPTWRKVNPADAPILILALTSATATKPQMYDLADSVMAQKLAQIEGVGQVFVGGSSLPAVRAEVNPLALSAMGIGLEQVRTALGAANANSPKGSIANSTQLQAVYDNDQLFHAAEYKPLIISYHDGAPVRLSDVSHVEDSIEDIHTAGLSNGKPAILLIISRQPGANIIGTVDRVLALLPELQASIPPPIRISVVVDRTTTIRASVRDVQITLVISVVLVILVVFVFLRNPWATAIPSVAVPLSLIGTFGVMYLLGYSLDNLSLMALTISTGFVVDDAIVVIENISRYLEQGYAPMEAALKGASEIGFTVLSMSTSLVAVFIPILLMGGIVGRLFREFAVVLSAAVGISMIVSLTTTPMMCAKLLRHEDPNKKHNFLYRLSESGFNWLHDTYVRGLRWVLRHQPVTLLITGATIALAVYLYVVIPKGFFPQQDTGRIMGGILASQDISFQAMQAKMAQFIDIVKDDQAVDNVVGFSGGGSGAENTGRVFAALKPLSERKLTADQVIARLRRKLSVVPGATLFFQAVQDVQIGGRLANAQYQYTLQGDNLEDLMAWAPKMQDKLKGLRELRDFSSDQQNHGLEASLVIDRDTASRLGLAPATIDNVLYDAFGQRQVSTMYTEINQYHVVMEVDPKFGENPDALNHIYVPASNGEEIPLSAFTHYEPDSTSLTVNHQGQFPAVTFSFNLAPGVALGQAVNTIMDTERTLGLPADIHPSFQGTAQAFQSSLSSEPLLILAALFTVYIVLGMLYESYIHPITILSTLPSAGVGALLALLLFKIELTIIALVGIILLIGIVKKNAIMMIDFAVIAERDKGMAPEDAIYEACLLRFRPIMMTTAAALFGGLPIALGTGMGAELRRPLGIAIVGGLIVSQMLTLFTTPVLYLYMDRLRLRLLGVKVEKSTWVAPSPHETPGD